MIPKLIPKLIPEVIPKLVLKLVLKLIQNQIQRRELGEVRLSEEMQGETSINSCCNINIHNLLWSQSWSPGISPRWSFPSWSQIKGSLKGDSEADPYWIQRRELGEVRLPEEMPGETSSNSCCIIDIQNFPKVDPQADPKDDHSNLLSVSSSWILNVSLHGVTYTWYTRNTCFAGFLGTLRA